MQNENILAGRGSRTLACGLALWMTACGGQHGYSESRASETSTGGDNYAVRESTASYNFSDDVIEADLIQPGDLVQSDRAEDREESERARNEDEPQPYIASSTESTANAAPPSTRASASSWVAVGGTRRRSTTTSETPDGPAAASFIAQEGPAQNSPAQDGSRASTSASASDATARAERSGQPIIIYQVQLYLAVFGLDEAKTAIGELTRAHSGYVSSEDEGMIVVRIPAESLREFLTGAGNIGDITRRVISASDVTDQYTDLEIRVRNLRAVRTRLEAVLARANTIEDTIRVEQELRRITQELEQLEGQLSLMRNRVAFSTVTIRLSDRDTDRPRRRVPLPFAWLETLGLAHLIEN